jgi:hypothetical protein
LGAEERVASVNAVPLHPSWARLVRTFAGVVDGVERLAKVVGEEIGGSDGVLPGPDLNGAVAA